MEKYKVFLGSEIAKTYDEAKNFTLARVEEYVKFNHKELFSTLAPIDNFTGNVFSLIDYLNDFHRALASKHLLENDISGFKENASIAGFLGILSEYDFQWAYNGFNTNFFFMILLSDTIFPV